MGSLKVSGTIQVAPFQVTDGVFPGGVNQTPINTTPTEKAWAVQTDNVKKVNSPNAFVALPGIGAGENVTVGEFLYLKCDSSMRVRLTELDPGVGVVVGEKYVQGLLILETSSDKGITLVEVKGSGTVEYICTGQQ
jgi:hypothetical protein